MPAIVEDMRSLITHRVSLEDFDAAVSAMASPDAIKVHLQPQLRK
jgi:threonine dehydrogenase-like Zn-dependent dehydrogenase